MLCSCRWVAATRSVQHGACAGARAALRAGEQRLYKNYLVGHQLTRAGSSYTGPGPREKQPAQLPEGTCRGEKPPCPPRDAIRPSQNDPYRIKVPDAAVEPLPPSKATPQVMCPCRRGMPCAPRGKLCVPPTPPPPPPPPFPWHYYYPFAIFLGFFGLAYQMYLWKLEADKRDEVAPVWRERRFVRRPFYFEEMPKKVQYLIIGAGTAAMAAYNAIKEFDKCAKVFLISAEDILPYERTALNKGMWFNPKPPDPQTLVWQNGDKKTSMFYLKPAEYTDVPEFAQRENGPMVSVATGWRVARVDPDDHICYVDTRTGEQPIEYEKCLIATGSKARTTDIFRRAPREVRKRVCRMRTIRDLELAYDAMSRAERCVIVGSGPLASELSWTLGHLYNKTDRGEDAQPVEVVHMSRECGLLGRAVPDYLAEWAAEKIKDEGVVFLPKTEVYDAYINENDRLSLYLSSGKEMETDYVFLCVGADPDVTIALPSMLELDSTLGGFLVNTEMLARTDLYVAGDAASMYQQVRGERERHQHLLDAATSGCLAGENMTGRWTPFNQPPHYHIRIGENLHMEAIGEVDSCMTTVGVYAQCTVEEAGEQANGKASVSVRKTAAAGAEAPAAEQKDEKPCYKKTEEYRKRYEKGIIYYMQNDRIAGIVFWNIDEGLIPERKDVVVEMLRAEPTYADIDMITDLLRFYDDKC